MQKPKPPTPSVESYLKQQYLLQRIDRLEHRAKLQDKAHQRQRVCMWVLFALCLGQLFFKSVF